jgi:hypothetical protein
VFVLFGELQPKKVRDRLMKEQNDIMEAKKNNTGTTFMGQNRRLKTFLNNDGLHDGNHTIAGT